ncbi:5'-methylthioadenosine/S-adenosylhomocysteine nucleosidase [Actinoplanes sp. TBRC 11911]|uniref:hypothetical protein n=1 Tax=Actinoplanes sp. TBRC 11911 TaxID=2729386 RepID=UPI00145F0B84|nr:hypothetical protein [Actinoplanes sp. TBRC 11911]NMO51692.1 5'-methylthioadenosine/S-adenosylhomocysteine nucleosidase [Actinoplanes sp. TBRC 11911]
MTDALVLASLPLEFDAARDMASVRDWRRRGRYGPVPYLAGDYRTADGRTLSVALARPARLGGRAVAPIATTLAALLHPHCIALTGIRPDGPAVPGDVIIAHSADDQWRRAIHGFRPDALSSFGAADEKEALLWLLERLARGEDPVTHPARARYFPAGTWQARVGPLLREGLIRNAGHGWELTADGRAYIRRHLFAVVDPPHRLPFAVHVAPAEDASIAAVARESGIPHWLIVQGVSDRAEYDRYRDFAAHAAAEVLWALLADLLGHERRRPHDH